MALFLVQLTGLEPEPTYMDMNLNHARMPIPPQLHISLILATKIVYHIGFEIARENIKKLEIVREAKLA